MSETAQRTAGEPRAITRYGSPDAPWNQEFPENPTTWNHDVIREFRANAGRVGGAYADTTLLLLTTTGARTGKRHVVPLAALYRGDTLYVSSFAEDRYPAWYHNVRAHPEVIVEIGDRIHHGTARALTGAEYDEFAAEVLRDNSLLADFQATVALPIPLVVLTLHDHDPN
ncbi:nitroreductase/quinone reductase family protein [Nocardia paucivorans]|uniref:nitroreductase/quinone reductase family protein n=1 Tax=Nocardia paucivorans TaxID=114259 RepID=UPI0002F000E9|nr:nitroreductase/quinone reductase family protein [Nocardia paucivorans]